MIQHACILFTTTKQQVVYMTIVSNAAFKHMFKQ